MKKLAIILIFISFLGVDAMGQSLSKELTGGITINTRSSFIAGIQAKYSRRIDRMLYQGFGFEFVNIKHPKELKVPSAVTASTFILGKNNYLFSLRANANIEKVLFEKDPDEGVRVSLLAAAGPSLGILKPYIIQYERLDKSIVEEQYNPDTHPDFGSIQGNAGWYRGFGDAQYIFGGHAKTSILFEYSTIKNRVSSIEAGFMYEQLTKAVELNPFVSMESSFFTAFVNISLGKKL